jgi:HEAT repeat protein
MLFGFAKDPEFERYSALALYRLHTPRSMEALAELVRKGPPGSSEALESAKYLARSGDQKWYPLLLEAARKSPQIGYPTYAADLGGKASISALVEIANTSIDFASYGRPEAIAALGSTHSREAIPILLNFLQSGDEDTSDHAASSLRQLTHRTAFADPQAHDHNLEVIKWSQWWKREGATARIYREDECAAPVPLP